MTKQAEAAAICRYTLEPAPCSAFSALMCKRYELAPCKSADARIAEQAEDAIEGAEVASCCGLCPVRADACVTAGACLRAAS